MTSEPKHAWVSSSTEPLGRLAADLWWPRDKASKCDLCECMPIPTDRCRSTDDGTLANLCLSCWAGEVEVFHLAE